MVTHRPHFIPKAPAQQGKNEENISCLSTGTEARREAKWDMIESAIYRQAKEALSRSEEKYRTLFNSMAEGFALGEIILDSADAMAASLK